MCITLVVKECTFHRTIQEIKPVKWESLQIPKPGRRNPIFLAYQYTHMARLVRLDHGFPISSSPNSIWQASRSHTMCLSDCNLVPVKGWYIVPYHCWKGNRRSGVALTVHALQPWVVYPPTGSRPEGGKWAPHLYTLLYINSKAIAHFLSEMTQHDITILGHVFRQSIYISPGQADNLLYVCAIYIGQDISWQIGGICVVQLQRWR